MHTKIGLEYFLKLGWPLYHLVICAKRPGKVGLKSVLGIGNCLRLLRSHPCCV